VTHVPEVGTTRPTEAGRADPAVRPRALLRTWLPTALGASMLVAEIPLVAAAAARSEEGGRALAALGIGMAVLVVVNTPALAIAPLVVVERQRPPAELRRYALAVGLLGMAVLLALGALPPLLAGIRLLLGIDDALTASVRAFLLALAPNSVGVAIRRHLHGRLIAAGRTGPIGPATLIRIGGSAAVAWAGVAAFPRHGALVAGLALSLGAFTEAALLALAARRLPPRPGPFTRTGTRHLVARHAQLSSARLLVMVPALVTTVAVAHSARPAASLVAWPAVYGLAALFASPATDWESVTATALQRDRRRTAARRVTGWLVAAFSGAFVLVVAGGAAEVYLRGFVAVPAGPAGLGLHWLPLLLPLPVLWIVRAYLRGVVMAGERAGALVGASVAHLATLVAAAAGLSLTELPGVAVASVAVLAGLAVDVLVTGVAGRDRSSSLR
jgi:hypothetical protein